MLGPGTRIHRFVIDRLLGKGGMAEVYAARDTHLRRLVALKRLLRDRDDAAATARLLREARAAASFQHPCAVVVFDVFEHEGSAYMSMELVSGRTLRSYVGDPTIPVEKRLRWLVDVARALGAAHRAGLVHRDVKPHNVMVRDDGMIKVLDFGIARSHARKTPSDDGPTLGTLTDAGAVVGTPLYASPEQLSASPVDERSDQFGWGVMGYELCCGLLPWRRRDTLTMLAQLVSNDVPTMLQRVADAARAYEEALAQGTAARLSGDRPSDAPSVPPPPGAALYADVPPEVEPILRRAMARDPAVRFPTIDDAADLLEDFAEAPPSMRYIPRQSLASGSDVSSDPLARSGATPAAAGEGSGPQGGRGALRSESATSGSPSPATSGSPSPATSGNPSPATSGNPSRATPGGPRASRDVPPSGRDARTPPSLRGATPESAATPGNVSYTGGTPRSPGQPERPYSGDAPPSAPPGPESEEPVSSSPDPSSATPTALSAIAATESTTGGRIATGGSTIAAAPERRESSPPDEEQRPLFRRPTVLIGSFALVAAAAVAAASAWSDRGSQGGPGASPSAAAPPVIARVACAPAEVRGAPPAPDVKDAPALFGQAACVRLAIALGVPWDPPSAAAQGAAPLAVVVEGAGATRVTVTLAGRTASAEAPKPLPAVGDAARALAAMLAAPAVPAERQAEIGAEGDAARRVDAILRARAARLSLDPAADLAEAAGLAPRSPWPRLLLLPDAAGARARSLREEVLAAAAALPGPLAEAARGLLWLRAPKTDAERQEATAALRRAYAARPDDGLVAAGLAEALLAEGLFEEAAAVGMRIADRAPEQSIEPLALIARGGPADPAWLELRGRALERLEALLPEARGWDTRALHEALAGRVEAARASLALGDALGLPSSTGRGWARDLARAAVAIAGDRPAEARALVQPFVGSPITSEADLATRLLVQTHLLEGNVGAAETVLARDIARLDALGDPLRAAERWITLLGVRRRLDQPPSDFADVKKLEAVLPAIEALQSPLAPVLRAEMFFVQLARKEKRPADAAEVKDAIEAYARKVARHDRTLQDDLAIHALPVAMVVSGLGAVRETWASLAHARFSAKLPYMLVYGIASEKAGADEEAERAYRTIASSPLAVDGLEHLAARFRLARLLERLGRKEEAARWKESTKRILVGADKGLVEALDRHL